MLNNWKFWLKQERLDLFDAVFTMNINVIDKFLESTLKILYTNKTIPNEYFNLISTLHEYFDVVIEDYVKKYK